MLANRSSLNGSPPDNPGAYPSDGILLEVLHKDTPDNLLSSNLPPPSSSSAAPSSPSPPTPPLENAANVFTQHVNYYNQLYYAGTNSVTAATAGVVELDGNDLLHVDEHPEMGDEVKELGTGLGFFGGLIFYGWYYYKRRIAPRIRLRRYPQLYHYNEEEFLAKEVEEIKKKSISWVDRYEFGSMLGLNIGQSIGSVLPLPTAVADLFKNILGSAIGFITGVIFATCLPDTLDTSEKSIFKLGKDGWTTYSKTGMMIGGLAGALLMGLLFLFLPIPGGVFLGLGLGTAGGSVIGACTMAGGVPLVNKLFPNLENSSSNKLPYRSNYIRAGMSFWMAIGGIFGFVLSLFPPFSLIPFSSLVLSTIFTSVFGLIGAAVLGAAGPAISALIDPDNKSYDNWDYNIRSAASWGNELGKGVSYGYKLADGNPAYELKNVASGGFVLLSAGAGLIQSIFFPNKKPEPGSTQKPPLCSWSKRIWLFGSLASTVGSVVGLAGGPMGSLLGASVGFVVGGVIGVVWGDELLEKCYRLENKTMNKLLDKFVGPKPEIPSIPAAPFVLRSGTEFRVSKDERQIESSPLRQSSGQAFETTASQSPQGERKIDFSSQGERGMGERDNIKPANNDVTPKFNPAIPHSQNLNNLYAVRSPSPLRDTNLKLELGVGGDMF